MMKMYRNIAVAAFAMTALGACHAPLQVTSVEGHMVRVDSAWDANPNREAAELIAPYKLALDSIMTVEVGRSEITMTNMRPEDCLQNLVADVLRNAATPTLGHPADMGLMNIGGLRATMSEGVVTVGNVFELLPFENALCVMTLDGATMRDLMAAIAARGGEGISGATIVMNKDLQLTDCTVGGEPIDDSRLYTVATIDYLAGGNDGMTPLTKAKEAVYPKDAVLRDIFMNYVKGLTAEGKALTSKIEGRIVVE
jgi:2',3'-cyclic-nucleotide 2'-phosphodiesterase (5'-nucleotidase family)